MQMWSVGECGGKCQRANGLGCMCIALQKCWYPRHRGGLAKWEGDLYRKAGTILMERAPMEKIRGPYCGVCHSIELTD